MKNFLHYLVAIVLAVGFMSMAQAQQLVTDGGFEDANNFENNWDPTYWDQAQGGADITSAEAHSGSNSVKITSASPAPWGGFPSYVGIQQNFNPVDNTEYVLTFWIKGVVPDRTDGEVEAKDNDNDDISLGVDAKNTGANITASNGEIIINPGTYNDWTEITYYWNSGSGNSEFKIDIGSYTNAGSVYYMDDFSMEGAGSGGGGGGDPDPPDGFVIDGGFENPGNFANNWDPSYWDQGGGGIDVTTEEKHGGSYSAKITSASPDPYGGNPSYVGIQQRLATPSNNTEYVMTFWIKGTIPDRTDGEVEAEPSGGGDDISLGVDGKNNTTPISGVNGELIISPGTYNAWTKVTYYWNSGSGNSNFDLDIGSYTKAGSVYYLDDFEIVDPLTSIAENTVTVKDFQLAQNFPNPFNPSTRISFSIPESENVTLEVYNQIGQKVETLLNAYLRAGTYEVDFNAQNLPSGMYFYAVTAGQFKDVKQMLLLK